MIMQKCLGQTTLPQTNFSRYAHWRIIYGEKFGEVYTPSSNISIDESLLLWKGRLGFKQYILLKGARFGIKCFMLCKDSGYTFKFKIYTGRENVPPPAGALSVSTGTPAYHCCNFFSITACWHVEQYEVIVRDSLIP